MGRRVPHSRRVPLARSAGGKLRRHGKSWHRRAVRAIALFRRTGHPVDAPGDKMSDIGVAEIPVDEQERPLPPPPRAKNLLVDGPILSTLLRLAWPNVIALTAGTCVVIAETSYIGR